MNKKLTIAAVVSACLLTTSCGFFPKAPEDTQSKLEASTSYEVLGSIPHDSESFTQGLEFLTDETLVESSGLYGESRIQIYDFETNSVVRERALPDDVFGEGLTVVGDEIIQLTWKAETAYVWDAETLDLKTSHSYEGEGWGLCAMDDVVWRTDGTATVTAHDAKTFEVLETVDVKDENGLPVTNLNELECVDDEIWANIWYSNSVIAFDPSTGDVVKRVNFTELVADAEEENGREFSSGQVLNGLAYHDSTETWFVTGKQWKKTYLVRLVDN